MKHRMLDLLACPECAAHPLAMTVLSTSLGASAPVSGVRCAAFCSLQNRFLASGAVDGQSCAGCYATEIEQAILHCDSCGAEFPVIDGVPRFNPDARDDYPEFFAQHANGFRRPPTAAGEDFARLNAETKKSFGFQWLRYRVTDHEENRAHVFRRTATKPGTLSGELFFEAGCGMGRYLKVVTDEPGAEVVGLDLSLAVNRAAQENRGNPARATLKGTVTDALTVVTTRLPHRVLHYLCYVAIPLGWIQVRIWASPAPVKMVLSPLLLVHVSSHEKREIRLLDTFDWHSPRYQWKHTVAEVMGWFRDEGFVDIDPSGFEVLVRGRKA